MHKQGDIRKKKVPRKCSSPTEHINIPYRGTNSDDFHKDVYPEMFSNVMTKAN
jgi:hypothetical protein